MLKTKRIYEKAEKEDSFRILVDRLWPRGVSKDKAKVDLWLKDIAPSDTLRKWFNHKPERWREFKKRYFSELKDKKGLIKNITERKKVTLVYSAKDEKFNNAVVLKEYIERRNEKSS